MRTGQTLRGTTRLAFDVVENVTDIVEGMYRNIAAAPLPFGEEPQGSARGIAGIQGPRGRATPRIDRDCGILHQLSRTIS